MPMKLLSAEDFREAAKDGGRPDGMIFRLATSEPETIGQTESRTKRFVFSDASVDLAGDVIKQDGWDLKNFERNPVALFCHNSWDPPIGRAANVSVKNGKLVGDIEFASADIYPFADTVFRLVDGGYLRAVSVGFMPKEWTFTNDKNRPYGIDFTKQLLCEISVCALPCNPNALQEARSVGIDTAPLTAWAEKVLDSGDTVFLPKAELETLRHQSGAPERKFYVSAERALKPAEVDQIRDAIKAWHEDATETPVLPKGVTLRTVAEDVVSAPAEPAEAEEAEADDTLDAAVADAIKTPTPEIMKLVVDLARKAGRRISAATKAKLQAALDMSAEHHDAMTKCLGDAMGDDPEPEDVQDAIDTGGQPPGSVVVESTVHLTPEECRLKEVAALRADLPKND